MQNNLKKERRKLYNSTENMPTELKSQPKNRKKITKKVIGEKQSIKYVRVEYANLPKQDYMKAKVITGTLLLGEYTDVQINDIVEFTKYIQLLASKSEYFTIKEKAINWITIGKTM